MTDWVKKRVEQVVELRSLSTTKKKVDISPSFSLSLGLAERDLGLGEAELH